MKPAALRPRRDVLVLLTLIGLATFSVSCGGSATAGEPCQTGADCENGLVCCSSIAGEGLSCAKADACPES
jgi:hypothetical protein